ncbi:MAG: hypothetical protein ACK2T2_12365, partial [Anaerolineales bacterium]
IVVSGGRLGADDGDPRDARVLEKERSSSRGLLSDGGASRGNLFSGDAEESLLTMSTVLEREHKKGPGFYFYLLNPYVISRLVVRFMIEILKELWQSWRQHRRKDPYRVKARNPIYAPLRGFLSPFMQDLTTYMVIGDVLRGIPAIYALYAGYDDLAHFAGMHTVETYEALHEVDRYFARVENAVAQAPRPYHIVVLSDHGQTLGGPFKDHHGSTLEDLVQALIAGEGEVYTAQKTHETWDKLSVLLTEAAGEDNRTARLLKSMLKSREQQDVIKVGPEFEDRRALEKDLLVVGSGCTGLIYFTASESRMTYEQIQSKFPDLLIGLANHEGIGFVMVRSEEHGDMVVGRDGLHYLRDGRVDGQDTLLLYGPNAAKHLAREASYANCPDILVNSALDPETQEMCCFEDQASHHGGLGGPQNHPFVLHPVSLVAGDEPIVGAESLYRVLRSWRDQATAASEKDA